MNVDKTQITVSFLILQICIIEFIVTHLNTPKSLFETIEEIHI